MYISIFNTFILDERNSETESQTNEDSSDTQISTSLSTLNHTTIHGSTESLISKPSGKQQTNGSIEKACLLNLPKNIPKIVTSGLLQKSFTCDSKLLSGVGLDSRPGTPKEKEIALGLLAKGDLNPNSLKHKLSNSSSNNNVKKNNNNNKKARYR